MYPSIFGEGADAMLKNAIPLIQVRSSEQALDFYCSKLGFESRSSYRPTGGSPEPAYHVLVRENATLHVSSFPRDGVAGGVVTIQVSDIQQIHDELAGRGVDVGLGIMDQAWGNQEVYVRDPDGNTIRFQSED
jgi:catechol 2,3-dioxygenase-like lactoylglutathione lyase family enzyme